jgi:hypothetical protein
MDNLLNADAFFMTVVPVWNSATVRSQVIFLCCRCQPVEMIRVYGFICLRCRHMRVSPMGWEVGGNSASILVILRTGM